MPFDPDAYLRETESRQPAQREPAAREPEEPKAEGKRESMLKSFGRGVVQGAVFDPVTGIGQLVEQATGLKVAPRVVRDWLKEVRDETEKTTAGTAGRWTGTIGSLALAPEAAGAAKAASLIYRAERMTGPELVALSQKLGRPETLARMDRYAKAVGKNSRQLTSRETAEALLGHTPGRTAATTLSTPARVGLGAGAAATQPIEGGADDYWAQKGFQALAGGSLGGLAGSALAQGAGRMLRPSWHSIHYPLAGYGLHALGVGPMGMGAAAGTLATLAALARGGGARSVSGLGGMAGEAVRSLTQEEPNAEASGN